MTKKEVIHFVITGGTIDSYYEGSRDTVEVLEQSVIPKFIESLKLYTESEFTEVCMKDSRALTKGDMQKVLETVENSQSKKIIITHGTYTMADTANLLKAKLKRKDQVVILTGSMIPLMGFSPSDAPFNLGYSLAKLDELQAGVYVCMNGRIFMPEEVMKMISEGRFTSMFELEK
ncbi:asparaginase [candidate division WS5 bacterium]|uniref:Asparaginase n=1 Tax=candidate division WS5 bacterium TaxID=2093353 RepID=A0A419DA69_9BACT|nr:MAG: asparaginase [candidate division WS5 bacterium]